MKFVTYIENRFQELQDQTHSEVAYNIKIDAKLKALHTILGTYRTALKWASVPKMLFEYWEVKNGLVPAPVPVLVNRLRQKQDEEQLKKDVEAGVHLKPVEEAKPS